MRIVILGKISYNLDDAVGTAVIANATIDNVALWVRQAISEDLELITEGSGTYRRARTVRDRGGPDILDRALPSELRVVRELQVGVYHHRVILVLEVNVDELSLGRIRQLRQHATQYARSVFDSVVSLSSGEGGIRSIVAFPVLFVPNGVGLLQKEDDILKSQGYSHLYSTTTTTFGIQVRATRIPGDTRRHFIRISVPGIIVYQAGPSISPALVNAIVDAVYYGALYSRAEASTRPPAQSKAKEPAEVTERGQAAAREMTLGTNDYLLEVVAMLRERVLERVALRV